MLEKLVMSMQDQVESKDPADAPPFARITHLGVHPEKTADSVAPVLPGMTLQSQIATSTFKSPTMTVTMPLVVERTQSLEGAVLVLKASLSRPFDGGPPDRGDSDGVSHRSDGQPPRGGLIVGTSFHVGITGALDVRCLKLDPRPRYKGGRFPGVWRFLTNVECCMWLMEYPVEKYVDIITTRCKGGPQLWINNSQCNILEGASLGLDILW